MTPLTETEAAVAARFEAAAPAPESWGGGDGLRKALAGALDPAFAFFHPNMRSKVAEEWADRILALPELAALRAKADADDRTGQR